MFLSTYLGYIQMTILANLMILKAANEGINNLNKLVDINGKTILGFLKKHAFPYGKFLAMTGHSLGANLATMHPHICVINYSNLDTNYLVSFLY